MGSKQTERSCDEEKSRMDADVEGGFSRGYSQKVSVDERKEAISGVYQIHGLIMERNMKGGI